MASFFRTAFSSPPKRDMNAYPFKQDDTQWKKQLGSDYRVLRGPGTELPFSGEYDKHFPDKNGPGVYNCKGCDIPLYTANHKFNSGCGWPAFFDAIPGRVGRQRDDHAMEIFCNNCGSHLGHVFTGEGFSNPTDERHCVNSVCLRFTEDDEAKAGSKESKA